MSANQLASITQVGTAFVPVADQDRALDFYTERLGFETRSDDIESLVARLRRQGVEVEEVGRSGSTRRGLLSTDITVADPAPPQCCFCDLDGNRFLLVQPDGPGYPERR